MYYNTGNKLIRALLYIANKDHTCTCCSKMPSLFATANNVMALFAVANNAMTLFAVANNYLLQQVSMTLFAIYSKYV